MDFSEFFKIVPYTLQTDVLLISFRYIYTCKQSLSLFTAIVNKNLQKEHSLEDKSKIRCWIRM